MSEINPVSQVMELSDAFGPSGLEKEVRLLMEKQLSDIQQITCRKDAIGNLYMLPEALKSPYVLLDAHLDEVGLMIQYIRPNGTMAFLPIGGMNAREVYGQAFVIRTNTGQDIHAVCGSIPGHYAQKEALDFGDLSLDAGTCSLEETEALGIEPGCFAVPDVQAKWNEGLQVMEGKAFDDRIGCAALIQTLRQLQSLPCKDQVMAAATVQEEVGERGSSALMHELQMLAAQKRLPGLPRAAICFEGCPADDTFTEKAAIQSALKKGPMIRARDRSMITDPALLNLARKTAASHNLPLQIAVRSGGGTNAGMYHLYNIPCLVIGIPVRYAHACHGFFAWQDYLDAVKLAVEIVSALCAQEEGA